MPTGPSVCQADGRGRFTRCILGFSPGPRFILPPLLADDARTGARPGRVVALVRLADEGRAIRVSQLPTFVQR